MPRVKATSSAAFTVLTETPSARRPNTADLKAATDGGDRVDYKIWRTKQAKISLNLKNNWTYVTATWPAA